MSRKRFFGIIITCIGLLSLGNAMNIIDISLGYLIAHYWPLILVAVGLFNILTNSASKRAGIVLLVVGVLLQLNISGYFNIFEYNLFWPIIFILIGFSLIFSKKDRWNNIKEDSLSAVGLFSGSNIKSLANNFQGGSALTICGGLDIDLRQAEMNEEKTAKIDLIVAFGGVDIYVSEGWNVVMTGVPLFGGWDNKARSSSIDAPTLKVNCFIAFGGAEVKN